MLAAALLRGVGVQLVRGDIVGLLEVLSNTHQEEAGRTAAHDSLAEGTAFLRRDWSIDAVEHSRLYGPHLVGGGGLGEEFGLCVLQQVGHLRGEICGAACYSHTSQ